jgi:ABC-type oligopeptide transport system substrate-binding subunit
MRFLFFNTRRGIFRDARLRRAASFALDRRPLAALVNERPTSSLLPSGVLAAGGPSPYPLRGDVARARALARGRGGAVVLATYPWDRCPWCEHVAALIRQQLGRIGIRVERVVQEDPWVVATEPHPRADLVLANWGYDWPDPSNFLGFLDGARPLGYGFDLSTSIYTDQRFLRRMRAAYLTRGDHRASVYRRLAADLMHQSPPIVALSALARPQLLGARVGCAVFRAQDHGLVDLGALCLR